MFNIIINYDTIIFSVNCKTLHYIIIFLFCAFNNIKIFSSILSSSEKRV